MAIISDKDQRILNNYTSMIAQHMKASTDRGENPQSVESYRAMMLAINPYKFPRGYQSEAVASFTPKMELRNGLTASVSIPKGQGPFPIMVHAHGHGLRAGSSPEYEPWIRLMSSYGVVVIFPDYRWQPEHSFEDQVDDMTFSIKWAQENFAKIRGDKDRLILGGDSAGGGLAMEVLVRCLEDNKGPRFRAFESVDGAVGGGQQGKNIWDRIKAEHDVPPFIMSVGSADAGFAAQARAAADSLAKIRKPYDLHIYYGMPHDFMKFPDLDIMHRANDVAMRWLKSAA